MKSLMTISALCVILVSGNGFAADEFRAFYLPIFSYASGADTKITQAVQKALAYNFNALFIQVRVRGDAYHYPNRYDARYPNPEPRKELYSWFSPADLDPLQHCIDEARRQSAAAGKPLEVHAWLTTYMTWSSSTGPSSPTHPYLAHASWRSRKRDGTVLGVADSAPLEHNLPEVKAYLTNLYLDVVRNYDVHGIHFDYIRLMNTDSGYHPTAKTLFRNQTGLNIDTDTGTTEVWRAWQRENVSDLVEQVCRLTHQEKPWVKVSAFVIDWNNPVTTMSSPLNHWMQRGYIDFVLGSSYQNTVASVDTDYTMFAGYVSQGGQWARPFGMALGSDDTYSNTPASMREILTTLRGKTLPPVGYAHFAYAGLTANSDARFRGLADTGYPYATAAAIPASLHVNPPDTVAPRAPASLSATLTGPYQVTVSFQRPLPAADGEYPVQYRIFRGPSSVVDPAWENLKMVFWDVSASRTSYTWVDELSSGGTYYYRVEAYDDWNNRAGVTSAPVQAAGGGVILDDGGPGYSQTGTWTTASSGGYNGGYRYASTGYSVDTARWTPTFAEAGQYEVLVWYYASSNRANNAPYTIVHAGGTTNLTVNQTQNGNQWVSLGQYSFSAGTGGYVQLSDQAEASKVVIADAVKFSPVRSVATPAPWESKPMLGTPYVPPVQTEIIVDNAPMSLNYDDGPTFWTHATSGTYGADGRLCQLPKTDRAVWTAQLTTSGQYSIDAYLVNDSRFTTVAQYRYVDGNGNTVNRSVSQQSRGTGWVSVDGGTVPYFTAGRVFISLSSSDATSKLLYADAVRLRLVSGTPTPTRTATPTSHDVNEFVVDNSDAGFQATGSWTTATSAQDKYGPDYRWGASSTAATKSASWNITLGSSAMVEVFAWWSQGSNRADNAPYTISHAGGDTTVRVNQQTNGGQWNRLGSFNCNSGPVMVTLTDDANPSVIIADAIRFVIQAQATPTATVPAPTATRTRTATVPPPPSATPTGGAQTAQLWIAPEQSQATIGTEVEVTVRLAPNGLAASYVGGFLSFEATHLRFVSGEVNREVFDNGAVTSDPQESSPGVVSWPAMAQRVIPQEVRVVTLQFEALAQGVTELTFLREDPSKTVVADAQFTELPAEYAGGQITIGQTGTGMGDADRNGFVNGDDFRCVRDHFGQVTTGLGDANFDGFVNTEDFRAVRDNFGHSYVR